MLTSFIIAPTRLNTILRSFPFGLVRFFSKSFSRIYLLVFFFGNFFLHQLYPSLVRTNKPPFLSRDSLPSATLDCTACSLTGAESWTPKVNPSLWISQSCKTVRLSSSQGGQRLYSQAAHLLVCTPFHGEVKVFALLPGSRACFVLYQDPQFGACLISDSPVNKGMTCTHGSKFSSTHPGVKSAVCPIYVLHNTNQPLFSVLDSRARYPWTDFKPPGSHQDFLCLTHTHLPTLELCQD